MRPEEWNAECEVEKTQIEQLVMAKAQNSDEETEGPWRGEWIMRLWRDEVEFENVMIGVRSSFPKLWRLGCTWRINTVIFAKDNIMWWRIEMQGKKN